jgi:hypothetical protein
MVSSGDLLRFDEQEIIQWISRGGFFIICLERHQEENIHLDEFLYSLGITVRYNQSSFTGTETEDKNTFADFQTRVSFLIEYDDHISYILDPVGIIRLVEVSIGSGALTVTGMPVFMYNYNLRREANAVLTWRLTGERISDDSNGILFIRNRNIQVQNSIFGAIMERGNLVPVIFSALVLIFVGFWMVIPVFGLVPIEKIKTSRPIKDRFIAEINFLKKYRALDYYLDVYEREQGKKTEKEKTYKYQELINQYRRIFDGTPKS